MGKIHPISSCCRTGFFPLYRIHETKKWVTVMKPQEAPGEVIHFIADVVLPICRCCPTVFQLGTIALFNQNSAICFMKLFSLKFPTLLTWTSWWPCYNALTLRVWLRLCLGLLLQILTTEKLFQTSFSFWGYMHILLQPACHSPYLFSSPTCIHWVPCLLEEKGLWEQPNLLWPTS